MNEPRPYRRKPCATYVIGDDAFIEMRWKGLLVSTVIDALQLSKVTALSKVWNICECKKNGRIYAVATVKSDGNKMRQVKLHRFLLGICDPKIHVDHADHNGLNNRIVNLNACSPSRNGMNRNGANKNSKSGIRGVSWDKERGKWTVQVSVNGKYTHIGRFSDIGEAQNAAQNALPLELRGTPSKIDTSPIALPSHIAYREPLKPGDVVGRLTVMEILPAAEFVEGGNRAICSCSCGTERKIVKCSQLRRKGTPTLSCGCIAREVASAGISRMALAIVTHGATRGRKQTSEYMTWGGMIQRCTNPKHASFEFYGGIGISVDPAWLSFENFIRDMGPRPSGLHSLERSDPSGPYSKGNCRWGTRHEQDRNKKNSRLFTFDGRTMIMADWARTIGISASTFIHRLEANWSIEQILMTPNLRGMGKSRACLVSEGLL